MRIALGSDEANDLTSAVEAALRERDCEVVLYGALVEGARDDWPSVGREVGEAVASGDCRFGVVCCWSGTGVSIAANKVLGVRAALCTDGETAAAARTWNDANVLALSLRSTTPESARTMLAAWFDASPTEDPAYRAMIESVASADHG